MSHPIYYDSITNEARLLEQLAVTSKESISALQNIYPEIEEPLMVTRFSSEIMEYKVWLIKTASSSLISCATRTRFLQDSYDFSIEHNPTYSTDKEAFDHILNIVEVKSGYFKHSIRACCNKIIHATSYDLEAELDSYDTEYWTGSCILSGKYNNKDWSIKLNAISLSVALRNYISIIKYL